MKTKGFSLFGLLCVALWFLSACSKTNDVYEPAGLPTYQPRVYLSLEDDKARNLLTSGVLDIVDLEVIGRLSNQKKSLIIRPKEGKISLDVEVPSVKQIQGLKRGDVLQTSMLLRYKQATLDLVCTYVYEPTMALGVSSIDFKSLSCGGREFDADQKGGILLPLVYDGKKLSLKAE